MADENETKIDAPAGLHGTESPAKSPVNVPILSAKPRRGVGVRVATAKPQKVYYKDQPAGSVCVYLMTAADWVKIGISNDPDWRRAQVQSACPFEVRLVGAYAFPTLERARAVETELHRLLVDFRGYGEWFGVRLESAQSALKHFAHDAIWHCTDWPNSRRTRSALDRLEIAEEDCVTSRVTA